MAEPGRIRRDLDRIYYTGGTGIPTAGVIVRRNRTESATRSQIQRILDNYFDSNPQNADDRLRGAAMRTWNALDATGRLVAPYGFSTRATATAVFPFRRRNNRR
jgi:hypothetical protein